MKKSLVLMLCLLNLFYFVSCGNAQIKCSECGENTTSNSKFCSNCGATLNGEDKNEYEEMLEKSRKNIAPYLEYLPSKLNAEGKIELDSEVNKNKNNVYFCGMIGTVSYHVNKYGNGVDEMRWTSNDFYTYEQDKALADILSDYFGESAKVEYEQYGQYNDTTYYWTDDTVPCTVILYTSVRANYEDKKDRIEIYWDLDKDIPD